MVLSFEKCEQREVEALIMGYVGTLSSPIDSFLEGHIVRSTFYAIRHNAESIGYFAIYKNQLLTQFYLKLSHCHKSQEVFQRVLREYSIQSIYVPTCDEFLLSLVLDGDYKINKQAYFFQDSQVEIPEDELYQNGVFRQAKPDDVGQIVEVSGDFLNKVEEGIEKGGIFTFSNGNELIGIGVLERSRLLEGYASIGMFTNENYRRQGVGRTVICTLKNWCYAHDLTPICGCYYHNDSSKQTLESAGMVTKTRLLNIDIE